MQIISPRDIYKEVQKETDLILKSLEAKSDDLELSVATETARKSFLDLKSRADTTLSEFEKDAEWDSLTIALYGETNAGKSTIIETLRILMGEKTKKQQQEKFIEVSEKLNVNENTVELINQKKININQYQESISNADIKFAAENDERALFENRMSSVVRQLEENFKRLSLWRHIISYFWATAEKKELHAEKLKLTQFMTETRRLIDEHEQNKRELIAKVSSLNNDVNVFNNALKELEIYQDGNIIGDGQSDFTRHSSSYEFFHDENKFVLIDVPGIEGNEMLVRASIMEAVRRAHIVFYVTRKPEPPQKGDEKLGQKGTLEKIKDHLGAQTEVWTIFNKSIKSSEQLRSAQLVNQGESDSLKVLDNEMHKQLGHHYAGSFSVSAYPAFVVSTNHFVPGSARNKDRGKFLAVSDASEILQKTGLESLAKKISTDMVNNARKKIRKSNFNKANNSVLQLKDSVTFLNKNTFVPLLVKLDAQAHSSTLQLESATATLKHGIESAISSLLLKQRDVVRRDIYENIERDIDNDDFKRRLEEYISTAAENVKNEIPARIEENISLFQKEVKDIGDQFKEHVDEFLSDALSTDPLVFNLDLKIDNGLSAGGILSSVIGAAALFMVPGVGWVAIALGALGVVVSVYKAVRSFLSSDYKKSQQREAANENIKKIFHAIESDYTRQLEKNMQKLEEKLLLIKKSFQLPATQTEQIVLSLEESTKKLGLLSQNIMKEGEL